MLKRTLIGVPALVLLLGLAACSEEKAGGTATDQTSPSPDESSSVTEEPSEEPSESSTTPEKGACAYLPDGTGGDTTPPPADPTVDGDVPVNVATSVGDLHATLDAARTPCTVNSFVALAEQGYFDGTSCHRMTTEGIFVLQCGDPTGTGSGGPGYSFADELDGTETYGPGTLAMANAGPNTNGSQFFIVYGDSPLPPSYTVFGTVDDATVALIEDVAADGVEPMMGPGDGAPKTPVDITEVAVG